MKIGKSYFIGTNILSDKDTIPSIKLDSINGVKYKHLIRKELKKKWKLKTRDVRIKHISNINNNHNYLVFVLNLNKTLLNIDNRINTTATYAWRSYYDIFSPNNKNELNKSIIYEKLSNIDNKATINITNGKIPIVDVFKTFSKIV
tara:strand:- start:202 stop:639 length:438 start_codon:yes stop_codon:yes gene_type:complete